MLVSLANLPIMISENMFCGAERTVFFSVCWQRISFKYVWEYFHTLCESSEKKEAVR